MNSPAEAQESANALLAVAKKRMSGREIDACEWTRSDDFEDEYDLMVYGPPEVYNVDDDEETEGEFVEDIRWKWGLLQSLAIEFSREISNWINKRNATRSRKAVRA